MPSIVPAIIDEMFVSTYAFSDVRMQYARYGVGDPIVIGHTMTGNHMVHEWWPVVLEGLVNQGYMVVCVSSVNNMYSDTIDDVTMGQAARLEEEVLKALDIDNAKAYIGVSMGGMRGYYLSKTGRFDQLLILAAANKVTNNQLIINKLQQDMIKQGMVKEARQLACFMFRSESDLNNKDSILNYFEHIGDKFVDRFGAAEYYNTLYTFNTHVTQSIQDSTYTLLLEDDRWLPPTAAVKEKTTINNKFGHDSILIEQETMLHWILDTLETNCG